MEINVDTIKELISCLNGSSLDILKLETDKFKLSLERGASDGKTRANRTGS